MTTMFPLRAYLSLRARTWHVAVILFDENLLRLFQSYDYVTITIRHRRLARFSLVDTLYFCDR